MKNKLLAGDAPKITVISNCDLALLGHFNNFFFLNFEFST